MAAQAASKAPCECNSLSSGSAVGRTRTTEKCPTLVEEDEALVAAELADEAEGRVHRSGCGPLRSR